MFVDGPQIGDVLTGDDEHVPESCRLIRKERNDVLVAINLADGWIIPCHNLTEWAVILH